MQDSICEAIDKRSVTRDHSKEMNKNSSKQETMINNNINICNKSRKGPTNRSDQNPGPKPKNAKFTGIRRLKAKVQTSESLPEST